MSFGSKDELCERERISQLMFTAFKSPIRIILSESSTIDKTIVTSEFSAAEE